MPVRLAILGHPVAHSLSPVFHEAALSACGMEGTYEALDVRPDELQGIWHERIRDSYDGLNVTIPHKVSVLPLLDDVSKEVSHIGAVNTLRHSDASWHGTNTDVLGVSRSLDPHIERFEGASAVVLGAGGGARAVLAALAGIKKPPTVHIINRDSDRAEELVAGWKKSFPTIDLYAINAPESSDIVAKSTLVVQSTSVGMHPDTHARLFEGMDVFSSDQVVFDLIYRPRETRFLRDARRSGATTIDGLEMFLHQAAASFEFWTGTLPPLQEIRPFIEKALMDS